jgi:hypothetical protein
MQRLLREQIEVIAPGTLVIAEEFGEWEDSRRRIDLLALDADANLVVIELKRTDDGGHMDLQALRYAAMTSTMTFEQVVDVFGRYLKDLNYPDDPRERLLSFLGWDGPDEDRFAQEIRIVLASAEFSRELTSTVMWLNERGLDIRCVRLHPYAHEGRVLIDVQQVIPLPEAADYQVRLREKVQRERAARTSIQKRDFTRYIVTTSFGTTSRLAKNRTALEIVKALASSGVPVPDIQRVLENHHGYGHRVLIGVRGDLTASEFAPAAIEQSLTAGRKFDRDRYFIKDVHLLRSDDFTYALTNQWGTNITEAMDGLLLAFPDQGISYAPVETDS